MNSPKDDSTGVPEAWRIGSSIFFAFLSMGLAVLKYLEVDSAGFPDGHLTTYERAVTFPLQLVAGGYAVCALCFFLSAIARDSVARLRRTLLRIAIVILVVSTSASFVAPWYYRTYLGLEHGSGG